jgi:hypothetical protein
MTKYAFGLLAACTLVILASPARAGDFSGECEKGVGQMISQPGGTEIKAQIDKKYGDNAKFCGCVEESVKKTSDVDKVAAYLTAINELFAKGGSGADADKLAGSPEYQETATAFLTGLGGCMAP